MDFSSMSGWDFERYCADCLLKKGFTKAEVTSGSGDHGVDIIAEQMVFGLAFSANSIKGRFPIRRCRKPTRVPPIMTVMLRSL